MYSAERLLNERVIRGSAVIKFTKAEALRAITACIGKSDKVATVLSEFPTLELDTAQKLASLAAFAERYDDKKVACALISEYLDCIL